MNRKMLNKPFSFKLRESDISVLFQHFSIENTIDVKSGGTGHTLC